MGMVLLEHGVGIVEDSI